MQRLLFAVLIVLVSCAVAAGQDRCASCAACTVARPIVTVERTVVAHTPEGPAVVSYRSRSRVGFTPMRSLILRRAFRGVR